MGKRQISTIYLEYDKELAHKIVNELSELSKTNKFSDDLYELIEDLTWNEKCESKS